MNTNTNPPPTAPATATAPTPTPAPAITRHKQLSIFLENSPGHLKRMCEILAAARVNIETLAIAETNNFGVVRIIVDKPDAASAALEQSGLAFKQVDVLAVEIPDTPGALLTILEKAQAANLNIEYMYALTKGRPECPALAMRFTDPDRAEKSLKT